VLNEEPAFYALGTEGRQLFRQALESKGERRVTPDACGSSWLALQSEARHYNRAGNLLVSIGLASTSLPYMVEGWDGRVFCVGDRIDCFAPSGRKNWGLDLSAALSCPPALGPDGALSLALMTGECVAYTPFGAEARRFKLGSPCRKILADGGATYFLQNDGRLFRQIKSEAPEELISGVQDFCQGEDGAGLPAWYVFSSNYRLSACDAGFKPLWDLQLAPIYKKLHVYPGRVYLLGSAGVAAVNRKGTLLKELALKSSVGLPAISPNGLVLSNGQDWILYAYRFDPERQADYPQAASAQPIPPQYGLGAYDRDTLPLYPGLRDVDYLDQILLEAENMLESGRLGPQEPEKVALCAAIASANADYRRGQAPYEESYYPQQRAEACAFLGKTGSRELRDTLIQVVEYDVDSAVRAAAIEALGQIAWDADGKSLLAIERCVAKTPVGQEPGLFRAAIGAISAISRYEGVPYRADGLKTLVGLTDPRYGTAVQEAARKALKALMIGLRQAEPE
jgi:hypothetical protein